MEMPPWHVGHVVHKLMVARTVKMTRDHLADEASVQPMTITNLLKYGRPDQSTLEKVAQVFGCTALDIRNEVERSNQSRSHVVSITPVDQRRRLADRDPAEIDAEQYARRIVRLANSAQTAIYNVIRAFEEAYGL